jgi:hypothetical protein
MNQLSNLPNLPQGSNPSAEAARASANGSVKPLSVLPIIGIEPFNFGPSGIWFSGNVEEIETGQVHIVAEFRRPGYFEFSTGIYVVPLSLNQPYLDLREYPLAYAQLAMVRVAIEETLRTYLPHPAQIEADLTEAIRHVPNLNKLYSPKPTVA